MKTLLFLLLVASGFARPTVESVSNIALPPASPDSVDQATPGSDLLRLLKQYRRTTLGAPQPLLTTGKEPFDDNQAGDILLWEKYTGQPIAAGDLFIADFPAQKQVWQCREAKAVTDTTVTSLSGNTISLSNVRGIVRRVIRPIEAAQ